MGSFSGYAQNRFSQRVVQIVSISDGGRQFVTFKMPENSRVRHDSDRTWHRDGHHVTVSAENFLNWYTLL